MKLSTTIRSVVGASLLALASAAHAHTISVGSFNTGVPGSVTIVLGTYDHGANVFQGSITLTAGPTVPPSVTQNFTSVLLAKPAGLIDGTNNFYADAVGFGNNLPSNSFNQSTNTVGLGPVVEWMAASFTGLTAGVYTYQLAGLTSVNWTNVNSDASNWTGTLVIPETSISGVPDAGSTLAMLGLALGGLAAVRRKLQLA